ncbi:MAG: amidohydrolase family protein [Gammaproteobacteria bacterium]|nr:amidohydrolase family protein [Gammaproteobacteria bacterium]
MSNNTDTSTIYDIKITGGTIVDGSGKPGYRGDVAIKDGKVVALGQAPGTATTTIDATDRMITPGFVDIHTHYDAQVLWDRMLTISPWHGVTTVVLGNCGFGVAPTRPEHRDLIIGTLEKVEGMSPAALNAGLGADWPFETFPQYLDAIEKAGTAINVGVLIGHTPTRLYVMGEAATEREATADEIEQMRKIVAEAMAAGAIGFATSKSATHVGLKGRPVPSRVASYEEVRTLVSTLKGGKGMMQATAGKELWFDEYEKLAEENDITISWTAMLAGMVSPDAHIKQQERTAELIAKGRNIVPQVTPRPLCFEFQFKEPFPFESLSVFKPVAAADAEGKKKYYADPEFRRLVKEKMASVRASFRTSWESSVISMCGRPEYEERTVGEVARELGVETIDLGFDLALATNLEARFRMPVANADETVVEDLLKDRNTVLGLSDAGAHASQLCDACLPTYLLGRWVRDKKAIPFEEAIRMLTARPADVFGIKDRGRLQVGKPADVVVIDPATVNAGGLERVYDQPAGQDRLIAQAFGVDAVIVNGVLLRQRDRDLLGAGDALPGQLLRRGVNA